MSQSAVGVREISQGRITRGIHPGHMIVVVDDGEIPRHGAGRVAGQFRSIGRGYGERGVTIRLCDLETDSPESFLAIELAATGLDTQQQWRAGSRERELRGARMARTRAVPDPATRLGSPAVVATAVASAAPDFSGLMRRRSQRMPPPGI